MQRVDSMDGEAEGAGKEAKEKLVIDVPEDRVSEGSDSTISTEKKAEDSVSDTATASEIEAAATSAEINTALEAFKALLDETVIHALSKDYSTSMTILQALGDAFCEKGDFSWAKLGKMTGGLTVGALASIFVVNTSSAAAVTLQNAFKQQTGIDISYGNIIIRLLQIGNTGGTAALATFSGMKLIETYFGHTTEAEKFLKNQGATCAETSEPIVTKILSAICAIGANIPVLFITEASVGIALAICTTSANVPISWLGLSGIKLSELLPMRVHPARRIELAYLNEQLERFLKLTPDKQNTILDEIDAIHQQQTGDKAYKQIYARTLNLAISDNTVSDAEPPQSCPKKAFAVALGCYLSASQAAFIEQSYAGIVRLFGDTTSAPAITSGSIAAFFSILPNVAFGYTTGTKAADSLTSTNMPLAKLYFDKSRIALQAAIGVLSLLAGGTSFTIAMRADQDLTDLANITGVLKGFLDVTYGAISYTTGALITYYYALRLCDDILIYFAQRCADANIRRLFSFVMEARRLHTVLSETTEENYLEILRWKMTGKSDLSDLLHGMFNDRMSAEHYQRTLEDVNATRKIMRDRPRPQAQRPEWQLQHPTLRRRHCALFSCSDPEQSSESQQSEMQPAATLS